MKNPLYLIRTKWMYFVLSALTGAVLATGMVVLLVSEKVGAVPLSTVQIAAIFVAAIAGGVLFALKNCSKKCSEEISTDVPGSGNTETKPS